MPEIKVQHVVSCSSEDLTHKADNLLKSETYRKWKCSTPGQRQISIILQFEKASTIHSIDVGNEGSAFVEILVGHSTSTDNVEDWQVILVTSSFMSPVESKNSQNLNRVRMFGAEKLSKAVENKKWDRVKIVCSQPFNKHNTYGLSFIKFHSPPVPGEETSLPKAEGGTSKLGHFKLKDTAQSSSITPGSYFKNRAEKDKETPPLTGAAAVRAASHLAAASIEASKTSKQPSQKRRLSDDAPEKSREKPKTDGAGRGREEDKRDQSVAKQPPVKKRRSEAEAPKQSSVSFKKLLEGVTFVMSGFQNPFRAELRDKAVEMGAKYKPDWGPGCTHLICAFANTPKYNQVEGKGKIVKKQWILDCHRKKVAFPWKRYKLSSNESSSEEESESEEEEEDWEPSKRKTQYSESRPSPGKGKQGSQIKGKSPMKKPVPKDDDYGSSTDEDSNNGSPRVAKATVKRRVDDDSSSGGDTEDELRRIQGKPAKDAEYDDSTDEETSDKENSETDNNAIPELPDFFNEKNFLIYGGSDMGKEEKRQVKRFIIAFGGNLENYMKDSVQYVITNSVWDDSFDQALTENASLAFIKPKWLYKCNEKSKFVPYQPFVVVPN